MDNILISQTTWLVAAATVLLGLIVIGISSRIKQRRETRSADHVFVFKNRELVDASSIARQALQTEDLDEDIFNQMMDRLGATFPGLAQNYERNHALQRDFTLHEVAVGGPISLSIQFQGDVVTVTLRGLEAPLSRKMIVDRDQAMAQDAELRTLRAAIDTAPFPMWRETAHGAIDWVNRAYVEQIEKSDLAADAGTWPPPRLFESVGVTKPGDTGIPHRKALSRFDGTADWFDITAYGVGENSLHFAVNANAAARAEKSQRNFLQTLTQTFSYLPTGLAIFDRSRKLVLFNPALTDLTSLEPTWLSLRPTLYDFLNMLREKRMLPERRDFTDWRGKINALEQSASDGTYCESWTLPTGQTYRVTGRPHPEGAIAFLFENITSEITLTRKFRQELELSQSIFDSLNEAIIVFGNDRVVCSANEAYTKLWGIDPQNALAQVTATDILKTWRSATRPSPLWGDVRDFMATTRDRSEWFSTARLLDGRTLQCRFSPLAGGATLVAFREIEHAAAGTATLNPSTAVEETPKRLKHAAH